MKYTRPHSSVATPVPSRAGVGAPSRLGVSSLFTTFFGLWISARAPLTLDGGYEWYRPPSAGTPSAQHFAESLAALDKFVAEVREAYPVDPAQLYLFGFSQGSFMAYALALRHGQQWSEFTNDSLRLARPIVGMTTSYASWPTR